MSGNLNRDQFGPAQSRRMWHLTDNPDFGLDPEYQPEDNALSIRQRESRGLYMTDNPEHWINGQGYHRPFAAELEVPEDAMHAERWGGEMFMPAENFSRAKVSRVIPTDAYARETYGAHGWFEDRVGRRFDTDEEIPPYRMNMPKEEVYPFKGYRYEGPDAREMDEPTRSRIRSFVEQASERWSS